jgi:hypothetical protein
LGIVDNYFCDGKSTFSGSMLPDVIIPCIGNGSLRASSSASQSYTIFHNALGKIVSSVSNAAKQVLGYLSGGGLTSDSGAIYVVSGRMSLSGTADVQIYRIADLPTGGMRLNTNTIAGGRYFYYDASGKLTTYILDSSPYFVEIIPYFLSIQDTLEQNRQNPCALGRLSKHAIYGLLTGTTTQTLLDRADRWEIQCFNSPENGDVEIELYRDNHVTTIVCNVYHPQYPIVISQPVIRNDFGESKQYKMPIIYPNDVVYIPDTHEESIYEERVVSYGNNQYKLDIQYPAEVIVYHEDVVQTANVAVLPTQRTELPVRATIKPTISQSGLLSLLGRNHFLQRLPRSQWKIIQFMRKEAIVELNGRNKVSVVID